MSREILGLTKEEAFEFFVSSESYLTLPLPSYFDFKPTLDFVKSVDETIGAATAFEAFKEVQVKPNSAQKTEGVNHIVLTNKDGRLAFRRISITNPYVYYFLVKTITEEENWKLLQERFDEFKRAADFVHVSSLPRIKGHKDKSNIGASIASWWQGLEQESIRKSLEYNYCFQTDISNCYPSIYLHSISWAIYGIEETKRRLTASYPQRELMLGTQIERYLQAMQYQETVGIPLGSTVYDFIAEIVLGYIDDLFAEKVKKEGLRIEVLRYRDDYRIFSNSAEDLNLAIICLQQTLARFKLNINPSKTEIKKDLILGMLKEDKVETIYRVNNKRGLQNMLLQILALSRDFPNSGSVATRLTNILYFCERCGESIKNKNKLKTIIAIAIEIGLRNLKFFHIAAAVIGYFFDQLDDIGEKEDIFRQIKRKIAQIPNIGYVEIWLQRMIIKLNDEKLTSDFQEPLCKLLTDSTIRIWETSWVKNCYTKNFPWEKIFSEEACANLPNSIKSDEVTIFRDPYKDK